MKKFFGVLLCFCVIAVSMFSLTSCMNDLDDQENEEKTGDEKNNETNDKTNNETDNETNNETEDEKTDEELIIGKWETELDMSEAFYKDVVAEDELMAEYFNISGFALELEMEFKRNGKCIVSISEESAEEAMNNLKQCVIDGFNAMFYDMANEFDMTAAELHAAFEDDMGMTLEEYADFAFSQEEFVEELEHEGKYKLDSGKLYFIESTDEEFDENEYITYTLSKDELKFLGETPSDDDDTWNDIYPVTFKRVKAE